jgi:hypothetical protein
MDDKLVIDAKWMGDNGKAVLTVYCADEVLHHDEIHLHKMSDRERFVQNLIEGRPGINGEKINLELERLAAQRAKDTATGDASPKQPLADLLVKMGSDADLFRDEKRTAYATVAVHEHYETWPIKSKSFRLWLRERLYKEYDRTAHNDALSVAIESLETKALFAGPQQKVYVRLAEIDDTIWLDLADEDCRVVRINADGWQVYAGSQPVKFVRSSGMLALPEPQTGGDIDQLRPFLNFGSEDDFVLLVSWLLSTLKPVGPYPILCIYGEQGSAKSTASRVLRGLVDPNSAPLRAEPREIRDLLIAANNARLLCFDNMSYIPPWLSDTFCRLSTGAGFATRQLYSDQEEVIISAQQPILLNGIVELSSRPDLLDRSITVTLSSIPEDKRQTETAFWKCFKTIRPFVLGALLDAVSGGMKNLHHTNTDKLPRMADFAQWVTACESAIGWTSGTFMRTYAKNLAGANMTAIESCLIGPAIIDFMDGRQSWSGTVKKLLVELESLVEEKARNKKSWPGSPRKLSADIQRITPNLRAEGIDVKKEGHTNKGSLIIIEKEYAGARSSLPSPPSPTCDKSLRDGHLNELQPGDGLGENLATAQTSSLCKPFNDNDYDECDGSDDVTPTFSENTNFLNEQEREFWLSQYNSLVKKGKSPSEAKKVSEEAIQVLRGECVFV